jgi:hypothetical protein
MVKKKVPLLVFDFDRTITNLNTDTEVKKNLYSVKYRYPKKTKFLCFMFYIFIYNVAVQLTGTFSF